MTDCVTDNIFWIQGSRMSWFNSRLVPGKRKKAYIIYKYYISYMLYISFMHIIYIYIAYICRVKSEWYINRPSFRTYIG